MWVLWCILELDRDVHSLAQCCVTVHQLYTWLKTFSLRFNGHFSSWAWVSRCQYVSPSGFELRIMEVVVMGGATDFKVGVQNRIRERSEPKKNFVPPLFQMWGYNRTSKQISIGTYWIYWNLLSGCHINKHRQALSLWYYESGKDWDSLVMARLVSWLNLAAICHTLYSARSDFRPLTSSRVCFEIMLGITNRIDDSFTYFEDFLPKHSHTKKPL